MFQFMMPSLQIRMSVMEVLEGYRVDRGQEMRAAAAAAAVPAEGYVKEFTRHSNDVLLNATLVVGSVQLRAHCAVLVACRLVHNMGPPWPNTAP